MYLTLKEIQDDCVGGLTCLPVGGDVYEVLDDATHPEAEGPPDGVVHGRRRDADRNEEQVGEGEILPKKV